MQNRVGCCCHVANGNKEEICINMQICFDCAHVSGEIIALLPADETVVSSLMVRTKQHTLALKKIHNFSPDYTFRVLPKHLKQMKHNYTNHIQGMTLAHLSYLLLPRASFVGGK